MLNIELDREVGLAVVQPEGALIVKKPVPF